MKKMLITTLAVCLYHMNSAVAAPAATPAPPPPLTPPGFDVPAECKNLALMETQLLSTRFDNGDMGGGVYNPPALTVKTANGYTIGTLEYLGGDGEDVTGPNAGKYPCDLDQNLCTVPGDAGGPVDWARITVNSGDPSPGPVAEVVVSMGSRGGCIIDSAALIGQ